MNYKFGKSYKLCSKILIDKVYKEGKELKEMPFILKYLPTKLLSIEPFQVVIVTPKKKFRNATTRNQIKRYIREAFRLNKHNLENALCDKKQQVALFLLYLGKSETDFASLEKKIVVLLDRLVKETEHEN